MSLRSISELAELTGKATRTIKKRLDGIEPTIVGKAHKFDSVIALERIFGIGNDGDTLNPQTERALLDRSRREEVDLRLAIRRGELLDADKMTALLVRIVSDAKEQLLGLPSRLAGTLIGLREIRDIDNAIRDEVYRVLTELADGSARILGEPSKTLDTTPPVA